MSPKPHEAGDVVMGRADWLTGEMHSDAINRINRMLGLIFMAVGLAIALPGAHFAYKNYEPPGG